MTSPLMQGNILDNLDAGTITVVGHQVNTRGEMSHGLARQIRERYPLTYTTYRDALRDHTLVSALTKWPPTTGLSMWLGRGEPTDGHVRKPTMWP